MFSSPFPSACVRDAFEMPSRCVRDVDLRFVNVFAMQKNNHSCKYAIMEYVTKCDELVTNSKSSSHPKVTIFQWVNPKMWRTPTFFKKLFFAEWTAHRGTIQSDSVSPLFISFAQIYTFYPTFGRKSIDFYPNLHFLPHIWAKTNQFSPTSTFFTPHLGKTHFVQ